MAVFMIIYRKDKPVVVAMLRLTVSAETTWQHLESLSGLPWSLQFNTRRHNDSGRDILDVSRDIKFFLAFQQQCDHHNVDDIVAYQLSFNATELDKLQVHRIGSPHTLRSVVLAELASLRGETQETDSPYLSELQGLHSDEGTCARTKTKKEDKKGRWWQS